MAEEGVRESMSALLRRVRLLVGDPNREEWESDLPLQDALDDWRSAWRRQPLALVDLSDPLEFGAPSAIGGGWEADVVLRDRAGNVLTPAKSLLAMGVWTLAAPVAGNVIYASGQTYDLYGAAADLLEQNEMANADTNVDMTDASGAGLKRSQSVATRRALIASYRARQRCTSVASSRSDVWG